MTRKKLQKILNKLDKTNDVTVQAINEFEGGVKALREKLQQEIQASTLDEVNLKINKLRKSINLEPLESSLNNLVIRFDESVSSILNDIESKDKELKTLVNIQDNNTNNKTSELSNSLKVLRKSLDNLIQSNTNELTVLSNKVTDLLDGNKKFATKSDIENVNKSITGTNNLLSQSTGEIDKVKSSIDNVKTDILMKISQIPHGGNANRQINVKSSVMSTKYNDINFANGGGIVWSTNDDTTNKRVNISASIISAGSGGSVVGGVASIGAGTGIVIDSTDTASPVVILGDTSVVTGTYGSDITVPRLTVNQQGRLTAVSTVGITFPTLDPGVTSVVAGQGIEVDNSTPSAPVVSRASIVGDVSIPNNSDTATLANVITAGGPVGTSTVIPVITFDAKGRLTVVSSVTASGSGTPGGNDTEIQFNDGGSFGGDAGLIWDKNASIFSANKVEVAPNRAVTSVLTINGFYPAYSGADATVAHTNANYSSVVTAIGATSTIGGTTYIGDGTYTEGKIVIPRSATRMNLSQAATVQADGATISPLVSPSVAGLSRVVIDGGKFLQTNATAQGVAIDISDTPNAWISRMRIEEFGTGIKAYDTASSTFYNSARDIQMFNVNNGIDIGGSQANMNIWDNVRIRPKAGGAGIGVNLTSVRGNTFLNVDIEPATAASITGVHIEANSRDNLFVGQWIENNEDGVRIDAGASNNGFLGGTITDNTNDIIDNGTGTWFWGTNKTGKKLFRIPNLTDINAVPIQTYTDGSGVTEFGQQGSVFGGLKLDGQITGTVQIQPASTAGNWTLTLPPTDGSANQVLTTDGNGITVWASVAAVGGNGITRNVSIITANTTGADSASTDYVYFANAGLVFTLPTAVANVNLYTVKNTSGSSVLVAATAGEDIDGSTSALMPSNYESLSFISNNSVWGVV